MDPTIRVEAESQLEEGWKQPDMLKELGKASTLPSSHPPTLLTPSFIHPRALFLHPPTHPPTYLLPP